MTLVLFLVVILLGMNKYAVIAEKEKRFKKYLCMIEKIMGNICQTFNMIIINDIEVSHKRLSPFGGY